MRIKLAFLPVQLISENAAHVQTRTEIRKCLGKCRYSRSFVRSLANTRLSGYPSYAQARSYTRAHPVLVPMPKWSFPFPSLILLPKICEWKIALDTHQRLTLK
jgi:hypothetical protein